MRDEDGETLRHHVASPLYPSKSNSGLGRSLHKVREPDIRKCNWMPLA